eukprot:scaffold48809_cov75-Phaeocystis_antarctica.AAC.4
MSEAPLATMRTNRGAACETLFNVRDKRSLSFGVQPLQLHARALIGGVRQREDGSAEPDGGSDRGHNAEDDAEAGKEPEERG